MISFQQTSQILSKSKAHALFTSVQDYFQFLRVDTISFELEDDCVLNLFWPPLC